jgi:hypothetical protein
MICWRRASNKRNGRIQMEKGAIMNVVGQMYVTIFPSPGAARKRRIRDIFQGCDHTNDNDNLHNGYTKYPE